MRYYRLCHVITSIPQANASWIPGSPLDQMLERLDGDVVQAMQALKEVNSADEAQLETSIDDVFAAFAACQKYCEAGGLRYPFARCTRQVQDTVSLLLPNKSLSTQKSTAAIQIEISTNGSVETFDIAGQQLPRLFNGLWQMASPEWGSSSAEQQEQALTNLVSSGFTAFDMSDHYGDAELVCGDFRARLPEEAAKTTYMATKWCVFRDIGRPVTNEWVLSQVQERCRRLSGRADMLQFHWYDVSTAQDIGAAAQNALTYSSTKKKNTSTSW